MELNCFMGSFRYTSRCWLVNTNRFSLHGHLTSHWYDNLVQFGSPHDALMAFTAVIIGTPVQGWMEADFADNSDTTLSNRPLLMMITDVDSITILQGINHWRRHSRAIQRFYLWLQFTSGGCANIYSLQLNGDWFKRFIHAVIGTHTITACFGLVCEDETVTVEPGTPVELIVPHSTDDYSWWNSATIGDSCRSAERCTGESITYAPSNGSMGGTFGDVSSPMLLKSILTVSGFIHCCRSTCWTRCSNRHCLDRLCWIGSTEQNVKLQQHYASIWKHDSVNSSECLSFCKWWCLHWISNMYPDTVGSWQLSVTSTVGLLIPLRLMVSEMASWVSLHHGTLLLMRFYPTQRELTSRQSSSCWFPLANWTSVDDGEINVTSWPTSYWTPIGLGGRVLVATKPSVNQLQSMLPKVSWLRWFLLKPKSCRRNVCNDGRWYIRQSKHPMQGPLDNWCELVPSTPDWYDQNVLSVPLSDEPNSDLSKLLQRLTSFVPSTPRLWQL